MTVFRAIQGFVGGAMVPTVFATGFTLFSGQAAGDDPGDPGHGLDAGADARARRSAAGSPMSLSWRWLFFINIVPGALHRDRCCRMLGKVDEPNLGMLKRIDWLHVARSRCFSAPCNMCWRKARAINGSKTRRS